MEVLAVSLATAKFKFQRMGWKKGYESYVRVGGAKLKENWYLEWRGEGKRCIWRWRPARVCVTSLRWSC